MEKLKKVSGTWRGTYHYNPVEHVPRLDPVPFTMILKQGWFGRFKGTVTDGTPGGMPGTGRVKGRFSFPRIEFTKRMPIWYILSPDGRNITMREYLMELGVNWQRDLPHSPILYEGEYLSLSQAKGTWTIQATSLSLGDGRAVRVPESRGNWTISSNAA